MTEIEQFITSQQRRRCHRMNANLTDDQCSQNRKRPDITSCNGCPGLGEDVSAPFLGIMLRFRTPEDQELLAQLRALSDDLEQDILALLHLATQRRLFARESKP